jgi:predicted transcriptional regulator
MPEDTRSRDLMAWTTEIVAAHLRRTAIPLPELDQFIRTVHQTLAGLSGGAPANRPEPAVPIKKSVMPEYIVCLEDGRKLKMLKRHLSTGYGMTPEQYRARWGLPPDYPMVAPNYARQRSSLAKKIGLGRRGRGA